MRVYLLCDRYNTDVGVNGVLGVYASKDKAKQAAIADAWDELEINAENYPVGAEPVGKQVDESTFMVTIGEPDEDGLYPYDAEYFIDYIDADL